MKKFIFTFLLSFIALNISAQQDYKSTLTSLLKHSETNFSRITGSLIETEENIETYEPKIKLGVGNEYIGKEKNSKVTFYTCTSTYKNLDSKNLERSAEDFIDDNFPNSKYFRETEDLGYNGSYYKTIIYEKSDKEVHYPVFIIELVSDININTELTIVIPGKSISE
jgi:hypothetical protein